MSEAGSNRNDHALNDRNDRLRLALEATRLSFGLAAGDITRFVHGAGALGVRGICVPTHFLGQASAVAALHPGWRPDLITVANFPTGDHAPDLVLIEISQALEAGAHHIDLVIPGELVADANWNRLGAFLRKAISRAQEVADRPVPVKVILETAAWDEQRLRSATLTAIDAGAAWLKTSTGFHPAGGATEGTVALLRSLAPPSVGVKASGGIRTRAAARALLDAGADRIGTSAEHTILAPPRSNRGSGNCH